MKREIDKAEINRIENELRILREALDDKYQELAEAEMQWTAGTILQRKLRNDRIEKVEVVGVGKSSWMDRTYHTLVQKIKKDGSRGNEFTISKYSDGWQEVTNE